MHAASLANSKVHSNSAHIYPSPTSNMTCVSGQKVHIFPGAGTLVRLPNWTLSEEHIWFPGADFTAYFLTISLALIGNGMILLTFMCTKRFQSVSNILIANLSVTAVMVALVCLPMELGHYVFIGWPFGDFMCKLTFFLQAVVWLVGVMTHTVIAFEMCLLLFCPMKSKWSTSIISNSIAISWLLAMTIASPRYFVRQTFLVSSKDMDKIVCIENWPNFYKNSLCQVWSPIEALYYWLVFIIMFVVPGVLIGLSYLIAVFSFAKKSSPGLRLLTDGQIKDMMREYRVYSVIAVVFYFCWTPFQANLLWRTNLDKFKFQQELPVREKAWDLAILLLAYVYYSANPLIIVCLTSDFKDHLKESLSFPLLVRPEDDSEMTSPTVQGSPEMPIENDTQKSLKFLK